MTTGPSRSAIERLGVSVYEVPTDAPESDDNLAWDATRIEGAGATAGLGYA